MAEPLIHSYQDLLKGAVPFGTFAKDFTSRKSEGPRAQHKTSVSDTKIDAAVGDGAAAIRFLIDKGKLDLGNYVPWNRVTIAWKNTYGDDGFDAWLAISAGAENYDGEDACRKAWDAIRVRQDGPQLTMATFFGQARDLGWKSASMGSPRDIGSGDGGRMSGLPKGTDAAAYVLELVEKAGDEFWTDQESKPHVSYSTKLPDGAQVLRHAPVGSAAYRSILKERFHKATITKVLVNEQSNIAASLLEFNAEESGVRHVAALRVGRHEKCIYVDLGRADGAVIEIDHLGWREVSVSPVRFVRGTRGELPSPTPGGELADFQNHFNLLPDDLIRLIGFLVGAFNVTGSYAILLTDGEQGAGKSTLNDKAVSLVDPPRTTKGGRMRFNAKEQDMQIGALGVHMPYFDNVTSFTGEAADALCRMSTGGGSGARMLYTDTGYSEINVIRPVVVTSIGAPSSRPDLLSRAVRITAQQLIGRRRTEESVMRAFEKDRPKMLGFLMSCVSAAIANGDDVEEAVERGDFQLPRMADFAQFVEGAADKLKLPRGGFSKLLEDGQSAMQVEAVLGTPVGAGLISYFSSAGGKVIDAPARDVLQILRSQLPGDARLPAANALSKALKRISVGLRALGIDWESVAAEGHDNVARFRIWSTSEFQPTAQVQGLQSDDGDGHF